MNDFKYIALDVYMKCNKDQTWFFKLKQVCGNEAEKIYEFLKVNLEKEK